MIETLLMIIIILLLALVAIVSCLVLREENKGSQEVLQKREPMKVQLSKEDKAQAKALEKFDGGIR